MGTVTVDGCRQKKEEVAVPSSLSVVPLHWDNPGAVTPPGDQSPAGPRNPRAHGHGGPRTRSLAWVTVPRYAPCVPRLEGSEGCRTCPQPFSPPCLALKVLRPGGFPGFQDNRVLGACVPESEVPCLCPLRHLPAGPAPSGSVCLGSSFSISRTRC